MVTKLKRLWQAAAFALRLVCFALLLLMFSLKLQDFLRQPVVSETKVISAALPAVTICPSAMNHTALGEMASEWVSGIITTEEVLQAISGTVGCNVLSCATGDKKDCSPLREGIPACLDLDFDFSRYDIWSLLNGGNHSVNGSGTEYPDRETTTERGYSHYNISGANETEHDAYYERDAIDFRNRNESDSRSTTPFYEDRSTPSPYGDRSTTPFYENTPTQTSSDRPTPPFSDRPTPPVSDRPTPPFYEDTPTPPYEDRSTTPPGDTSTSTPPPADEVDLRRRWTSRRVPPGITCHTLDLSDLPEASSSQLFLTLILNEEYLHFTNGYYQMFFHAEPTPKTWYGGSLASAYNLVQDRTFKELTLTRTETLAVYRQSQPCEPDESYDYNQCLLDCRSLVAFTEANCSVQWGAATGGLPPCITKAEYDMAVGAWYKAHPNCTQCPVPCRSHSVTLTEHAAMLGVGMAPTVDLQLRVNPQQLVVEQRLAYTMVDLLVDLGGTFGLLLGYSLMSLVDLLETAIAWCEGRRRLRRHGGVEAPPIEQHHPAPNDAVRGWEAPAGAYSVPHKKVFTLSKEGGVTLR